MSFLNKEFKKAAAKINAKLKEAAAALEEANELSTKVGCPVLIYTQWTRESDYSLEDLDDVERQALEDDKEWDGKMSPLQMKLEFIDVSDLESAICNGGWSTSSSYC
jgi:hypothetical protein